MSVVPQSYIRTGRKAKNIVAKMLNVPEQMKGLPSKIWNQFSFYSKLSSLEAVGRNGAATAFYSGKYDIKLQLDKSEVPMIGKDQIDIKKLQNQIMGAIEEARKHNHVHKYYEKSLYQISNDNSPKAETFSKPTHYASKRSEIKQDLTTLQEDDENQYMFKKVLQQMQKMDMEYQKDIQEYKKYLVKKDDLESVNRDEINSRVVFSSAFHDLANSLPASEANISDVKDMTTQLSEDSSRITDRIIDTEGTTFQSIHSLTYDSRLDPDAEPIGPFMHELIALKKLEQQVEEYEQEHGKGTFAKYMIESASNDMHTIYSSLESLEEAFSPEGREMWARVLFATNADENVAPIMEAVENIDPKLCASLPVTVVEEEVEEEK